MKNGNGFCGLDQCRPSERERILMTVPKQSLKQIQFLIFDLDGTLVDSETDLTLSVNAVRSQMGLDALPIKTISSFVGRGVVSLIERALGSSASPEDVQKAVALFLAYYRGHMLDHTVTYAGVRETLDGLKGWKMAVLTNKPVRFSRDMIAGLGLAGHFSFIYGGDSFERKKPDPMGVAKLMEDTGCSAAQTMIVGDSDTDVFTARNAGVMACGVTYGIGSHTLEAAQPDFTVDNFRDLLPLLNGRAM
ncbi:MAG TPA: HAD-IA family hydrolase [Terriglobia bacterium]|nr:HAD-IA family hydrolase [Terriglobia bacterium]